MCLQPEVATYDAMPERGSICPTQTAKPRGEEGLRRDEENGVVYPPTRIICTIVQYGILSRPCEKTKRQIPMHDPVLLGLGAFCPKKVTSIAFNEAVQLSVRCS